MDPRIDQGWVPAAPFHARFNELLADAGLPWRVLALALDLPAPLARRLTHGQPGRDRIRVQDAQRLMETSAAALKSLANEQTAAQPVRRRIRRLRARGLDSAEIARRSGITRTHLATLERDCPLHTSRLVSLRLQALEDELDHVPGMAPTRTPA